MRGAVVHAPGGVLALAALVVLTGCAATDAGPTATSSTPTPTATPIAPSSAAPTVDDSVVGTVVRFSSDDAVVDVTIGSDNPTSRDFLTLLPLTMSVEEFAGREKISYPPRKLDIDGSPGSDPEDGDLIYFTSWGNLGFYYNTDGVGYSDRTINLGTYSATLDELTRLEGGNVAVEIVD